jgi:flagellar biosynthesis/type III secretory pathway protein FliH
MARRVPAAVIEAQARAKEILDEASAARNAAFALWAAGESQRWVAKHEAAFVGLALAVAERLLGHALATAPETVASLARTVLRESGGAAGVGATPRELYAHSDDVDWVRGLPELQREDGSRVAVRSDDTLQRGSIRVETDSGTIDGRLRVRLDAIRAALGALARAEASR